MSSDELNTIIERIASGTQTAIDVEALRVALTDRNQDLLQLGKYNVNIGQGQDIHIGDRTYVTWNDEAIQALIEVVQKLQSTSQTPTPQLVSVDDLVQQVRSRLHDDIQCLHGTMPLWGVDRWVPLAELFVDVNILEEVNSSRKSELDDLWQDFTTGIQGYSSYRSLDRIGLGKERKRVSGLEVLAKNTNLMVVGKPGSGKTTYLQRVVTECNAGNLQAHRIPVLIKLREFVEDGREVAYSLERYLERCWRLSKAETQLVLNRGQALVLLDGLDEVTGEDGKNITKAIKRFARAYPQVQVIVTCRTQSQESRFERFDYVEVADFNEPQVRAFAQHWFKTVMGDESAGLARGREFLGLLFLEENKPIRELAITPILLSLTCAVFHQTGKFYSKRSKLYEEGLELLLEQWDKSRSIERDEIYRDLSVERKLELLSYLAVKKFEQPQYVLFEQGEIEGYIAEFLGIGQRDSRVVLKAIEAQHGLLIERAQKVWSFSHLTFQEYLVAKWFCDQANWQKLANYSTRIHWREIFLLIVSESREAESFLLVLKENIDNMMTRKENLQNFLNWLSQKSLSVPLSVPYRALPTRRSINCYAESYQAVAIRAFYLECYISSTGLSSTGFYLARNLDKDFSSSLIFAPEMFSEPNPSLWLDYLLMRFIYSIESKKNDSSFFKTLENASLTAHEISELELEISLRELIDKLPEFYQYGSNLSQWILTNGFTWTQQLRLITMKYRNVGYQWDFSNQEWELLQQYYSANILLIDCLNNCTSVASNVKEKMKEALLLPLTELEKYKHEKAQFSAILAPSDN